MDIDWLALGMGLFGGLALFLAGLDQLSEGLKQAAGLKLAAALERLTTNRVSGALTGAVVTALLNSSSVTTVLVVGFVTAGVMTLAQSVGVIMGANIGSTVTAQLLAFNVTAYALVPVAVGFFMLFAGRGDRVRQLGKMVMGLGLVFFGMGLMGEAMHPLRSYPPFVDALAAMERPLLGVLAGCVFTALVQSSAATVGIAIALASQGLLGLEGGIALALGANIGTCATALLASIGKPPAAVRAAVVHLSFNVLGVLIWLPLLTVLAGIAVAVSPIAPAGLDGVARAAAEVPRQLANANTLFNVVNTVLFLPFAAFFASLAERVVKERPGEVGAPIVPLYLDDAALAAPSVALENVRREIGRLAGVAQGMLAAIEPLARERSAHARQLLVRGAEDVAALERAILGHLARLRQQNLSASESVRLQSHMESLLALENLASVVSRDLVAVIERSVPGRPSAETAEMLRGLYGTVQTAMADVVRALEGPDLEAAARVLALDETVSRQAGALLERQAQRLRADTPDYLDLARLQMSIVDKLGRIYALAARAVRGYARATSVAHAG